MKLTLIHTKSETCRELFEFEVDYNNIQYVFYWISYRNDENDIWGDEWQEAHDKELGLAWEKINKMLDEEGYNDWDREISELKEDLRNKYWPTYCKTIRGETRCSGESGGKMPKYPWDEMELKNLLSKEAAKEIEKAKIH